MPAYPFFSPMPQYWYGYMVSMPACEGFSFTLVSDSTATSASSARRYRINPFVSELFRDVIFQIIRRTWASSRGASVSVPVGSCAFRGTHSGAVWSLPVGAAGDAAGDAPGTLADVRVFLLLSAAVLDAARFTMAPGARARTAVRSIRVAYAARRHAYAESAQRRWRVAPATRSRDAAT